ncbi:predicted protein [Plenodomus lingam JN3]|uniref:Predicted protein n=1 Tax=Leptosphaeria maculans (strain JN3 / isolate v23.1.3 / race Av1-4-5-6-7-8) TaxID=985895 RepID=E4ZRZ9_LEPMJ|nr:predicted protein [Plenodomus lingam JN3]CBX94179.1 predicted protein [Plenodomus lingam JN3]
MVSLHRGSSMVNPLWFQMRESGSWGICGCVEFHAFMALRIDAAKEREGGSVER